MLQRREVLAIPLSAALAGVATVAARAQSDAPLPPEDRLKAAFARDAFAADMADALYFYLLIARPQMTAEQREASYGTLALVRDQARPVAQMLRSNPAAVDAYLPPSLRNLLEAASALDAILERSGIVPNGTAATAIKDGFLAALVVFRTARGDRADTPSGFKLWPLWW